MRHAITILALAAAIYLHIHIGTQSSASGTRHGQGRITGEEYDAVLPLKTVRAAMQGERITVVGRISDIWKPAGKKAPHTLILRDDNASLEVVHWLKSPPAIDTGDSIECTGTVDLYRGRLQLRLRSPKDLTVLNPVEDAVCAETASSEP